MTTMAALLSALPLMLGTGVGSELRPPLGITMVGGLLLSQVLTLFTTPVIYLYFDRLSRRTRRRFGADDRAAPVPPRPGDGQGAAGVWGGDPLAALRRAPRRHDGAHHRDRTRGPARFPAAAGLAAAAGRFPDD